MRIRWAVVWGAGLLAALGVLVLREVAPARLVARGSESELASIVLEQRFDQSIRGPALQPASAAPQVAAAALAAGLLGLALAGAGGGSRLLAGAAASAAALCAGGLATLLGLGGPGGALAAAGAGITFVGAVRDSPSVRARAVLGPFVAVVFYLGVAVANLPAVRSAAAAAAAGTVVGWAAALTIGPRAPSAGAGRRTIPTAVARAGAALLLLLAAGAGLRPLPLEAADVAAPRGFQVVVEDPDGFRGRGFAALYRFTHALADQEGVRRVKSIATFVPQASLEQAQNFFLSPLGVEPSRELVAGTELTRIVLRTHLPPGSRQARRLVGRARALAENVESGATVLVGGRTATLVDVRAELRRAYWGLALALIPVWLALRLLGRGAGAATGATARAALAGAAALGLVSLLPNNLPSDRIDPAVALTVAAALAGGVAAAASWPRRQR